MIEEATWIGRQLAALPANAISPLLDIGSGDPQYRAQIHPYIETLIFAPLRKRGVQIIRTDLQPAEGIDFVGDMFDDNHLDTLASALPRAVVCSNVHEHVTSPAELSRRYLALLPLGGYAAVTVPHSYPYHRDPIDTLFRPGLDELRAIHPGTSVISESLIAEHSYGYEIKERPLRLLADMARLPRVLFDTRTLRHWRPMWLRHRYLVSCVLLRKDADSRLDRAVGTA